MKLNLNNLVRYHKQQISSRSLSEKLEINNPITIYAMDKDESISKESSSRAKLIQVLDGQLQITLGNDSPETLSTGELISIPSTSVHSFLAVTKCQFLQIEL